MDNNYLIPNFIKSQSPSGLRDSCLSKCIKDNKQYKFFDFQTYVDKRTGLTWHKCWYYEEFTPEELMRGDASARIK